MTPTPTSKPKMKQTQPCPYTIDAFPSIPWRNPVQVDGVKAERTRTAKKDHTQLDLFGN